MCRYFFANVLWKHQKWKCMQAHFNLHLHLEMYLVTFYMLKKTKNKQKKTLLT